MKQLLVHLFRDESGQDLIEYALLTTFVGLTSLVGLNLILGAINSTYTSWNNGVNGLWEPPAPGS